LAAERSAGRDRRGDLTIVLAAFCFGSTFPVTKEVLGGTGPFAVVALRFLLGGVLLVPFALRRPSAPGEGRAALWCALGLFIGDIQRLSDLSMRISSPRRRRLRQADHEEIGGAHCPPNRQFPVRARRYVLLVQPRFKTIGHQAAIERADFGLVDTRVAQEHSRPLRAALHQPTMMPIRQALAADSRGCVSFPWL